MHGAISRPTRPRKEDRRGTQWPAKLAAEAFDGATADVDGRFQASFGLMTSVTGEYADGRLVVDVVQLKGEDLQNFLDENGMEVAMESRRRWSTFLDDATDFNGHSVVTRRRKKRRTSLAQNPPSTWPGRRSSSAPRWTMRASRRFWSASMRFKPFWTKGKAQQKG